MIEYYWITDTKLLVEGERMSPEEAYKKYPDYADEIRNFVDNTRNRRRDFFHATVGNFELIERIEKDIFSNCSPKVDSILSRENKVIKIKQKISQIFEKLQIQQSNDPKVQFKNAYSLFEYIVNNSHYDGRIMDEKQQTNSTSILDYEVDDIYRCLCENRSVCSSDASSLSLLFRMSGIDSKHITIAERGDKNKGIHEVVLMNIGKTSLICDPTLVRSALRDGNIPKIHPNVFAIPPEEFFKNLYPTREIKCIHNPISLPDENKSNNSGNSNKAKKESEELE